MSDLDLLRSLGDQVAPPSMAALRSTADARARRTATTVVAATAAVALLAGGAWLVMPHDDDGAPEPAPTPDDTSHPITYALGASIHYGDRTVDAPSDVVELDVTDAGVVARLDDGGIWFTDGTEISQLGDVGEPGPAYVTGEHPYGATSGLVVSGNSGSLAAWFEFLRPDSPEVVVYDTATGEETARQPVQVQGSEVGLHSVTERYAYLFIDADFEAAEPQWRVDLATGTPGRISTDEYYTDNAAAGTPRTMVVSHAQGNEPVTYQIFDGVMWQFNVHHRGHVDPQGAQPLDARDGGTGQRFAFRAPPSYPDAAPNWLIQWLDDDTVVIVVTRGDNDALLACRFSTGACTVAERLPRAAVLPEIDG